MQSILWVDDQIEELRSQILFLEGKGFEVARASNGDDAISLIQDRHFDVILLDEMMPGKGGLQTLQEIREVNDRIPVIMITKSEEEELMNRALGRRIHDYLVKPVHPTQILMALKKIFDEESIQQQQTTRDYLQEINSLARMRMEAKDWRDWMKIYERMVNWEMDLHGLNDPALVQTHGEQFLAANAEFSRYVVENYSGWIAGEDPPVMSHRMFRHFIAPRMEEGHQVFLFVIDCMRLDQWKTLQEFMNPLFDVKQEHYYSILPTATPFARNAIFAGLLPVEIAHRYPAKWKGRAREEKSKNAHEAEFLRLQMDQLGFRKKSMKYFKTFNARETDAMAKQVPSLGDVDLIVGVINFLDILAHGRSYNDLLRELAPDESAFRSVMRSWFQHSVLFEMMRKISSKTHATVIITTDHGSVQVKKSSLVKANRDASSNVRYKYGDNLVVDEKEAMVMKNPPDFGLPMDSPIQNYICAKGQNYFVYPTNFHEYERQYKGSFQHGGISLEEMIIPCVTLTPR